MHKMKEWMEKLHNGSVKRNLVAGTLALFFATLLVMSMFELGIIKVDARGGALTWVKEYFWDQTGTLLPDDFYLKQKVTVLESHLGTKTLENSSMGTEQGAQEMTISLDFQREGVFQPAISAAVEKNYSTDDTWSSSLEQDEIIDNGCDGKETISKTRKFTSLTASEKPIHTYYKVYTDSNSGSVQPMGKILLEYYKSYYSDTGKKSTVMMITDVDKYGLAFNSVLEACAKQNGWTKYDGTGISLFQDDKTTTDQVELLRKVEMLTVSPVDFYFTSKRAKDNAKENRNDYDVMLYTSHTYNFLYTGENEAAVILKAPVIETESGKDIEAEAISIHDEIILSDVGNPSGKAKIQYCLSDAENTASISWTDYSGPFETGGKKYLYVRSNYTNAEDKYVESDHIKYQLNYMTSSSAIIKSEPENQEGVDVGNAINLSCLGASGQAEIFYIVDADVKPELGGKVSYSERQRLNLDAFSTDGFHALTNGKLYLKFNNLWYECSDASVKKYTDPIIVGEEIREKNVMIIYALVVSNGSEPGTFQTLQYSYFTSQQTAEPESTIPTTASEPATVTMGSNIGLLCDTVGSKIFYTTNGSAPVIVIDPAEGPKAGSNYTEEYTNAKPIIVNEEFAEYGKSFLLMAQAVTYKQVGDSYVAIYQDSPVAKFNYKVGKQPAVESVQSVPQTNSDIPTEVQVGSKIQLYSDTNGVTIYYTLDGSEPTFKESDTEPGKIVPGANTQVYTGTTGVVVPEPKDSSLFTITAIAYKEGLAVSDIVRFIYAYPGAVSSPYANPMEGAVSENTEVILKTATDGAVIYYEVAEGDATPKEPTTSSRVFDETNPIKITKKTTIKAFAVKDTIESTIATFNYTVSEKLKTPTPSIDTGAVISSGTVISLSADKDVTIYYTLDGSDPRDSANKKVQVGNRVVINGKSGDMIVLRTYAAKNGYTNSEVGTYSYSLSAYAGGIYADREDGEILKNGEEIHLHTDMSDADIYYTTDGSAPTEDSHHGSIVKIYGDPGEKVTVMAIAIAEGSEQSTAFATFTYTIMEKVAAPTSSVPDGAIFTKESMVELKAETGRIYYTTDGSDPSTSSNLYKKSIVIDSAVTIKAIAVADDLESSDISTFNYGFAQQVAAPIASYASGELEMGTKVTFTSATEGATIYYRTDGKDINLSRKNELEIYKEPITINQATNFKVIAVKDKMQDSNILKVGYTVKEPVVIEAIEEEGTQNYGNQSNRLQSRRSFSDTESGPSYKDVILRNASYGAIVAAEEGVLPDQVQLIVESTNVTDAVDRRVKQVISDSFGVVASYDVTLLLNGEETQPEGTIEIGLPIPVEYENAMIHIVHVQEDGNIELFETRRSGGVAYAKVDHLSVFSITAPVEFDEEASTFPWLPIAYTLAVGLTGIGIWLIYKAKKERREDGMQDV